MTTHVFQFPCLKDNYGVLIHDSGSGRTAAVDAPDGDAVIAAAKEQGWRLTDLLVTHHHADHVQGVAAVRAAFPELRVVGPAKEAARIGGSTCRSRRDNSSRSAAIAARVIETPGHTAGQVAYVFDEDEIAFTGDTLFSLGCGRVFETPLGVMWNSLMKLAALPGETQVYCGHEYTEANARFALDDRARQRRSRRPRRGGDGAARQGPADAADDDRAGARDQPVPARRESRRCRRRSASKAPIPRRCSRNCADARTISNARLPLSDRAGAHSGKISLTDCAAVCRSARAPVSRRRPICSRGARV